MFDTIINISPSLCTVIQIILCILHVNNNMRIHCSIIKTFSYMAIGAKFNLCLIITILREKYFISNVIVLQIQGISLFYSLHIYYGFFSIFSLPLLVLRIFHYIKINISSTPSSTLKLYTKIVCEYTLFLCFFFPSRCCSTSVSFLLHLVSLVLYNYVFTFYYVLLTC